MPDDVVDALLRRAHRLGREACAAACGPASTSTKSPTGMAPVGQTRTLLHITRSGVDLAHATLDGLETLDLPAVVTAGARADAVLHALIPRTHVDLVRSDAVLALGLAADGAELVQRCFGGRIGWLAVEGGVAEVATAVAAAASTPDLDGLVVAGRFLVTWADTSKECGDATVDALTAARLFLANGTAQRPLGEFGARTTDLAVALLPVLRGITSAAGRTVGHLDDSDEVMSLLRSGAPSVVHNAVGTLMRDTRVVQVDLSGGEGAEEVAGVLGDGDRPDVFVIPGVGLICFGKDETEAQTTASLWTRASRIVQGVSSYAPAVQPEALQPPCPRSAHDVGAMAGRVALVTGGGSGIGREIALRLAEQGACVVVADLDGASAEKTVSEFGRATQGLSVEMDVRDEGSIDCAVSAAVRAFGGVDLLVNNAGLSISKPLLETSADDWDRQHDVMARGAFLMSRAVAKVMVAQRFGGDIVYIVSKNAAFAGPNNIAYGATKANQAHQVRLLAAELGAHGIRVNGVNPDGVVHGSGIFANGWGRERAKVYGIPVDELGAFYAQRTLLKLEVLPVHVADAVLALTGGLLSRTTGAIIPVDGGVTGAFLR